MKKLFLFSVIINIFSAGCGGTPAATETLPDESADIQVPSSSTAAVTAPSGEDAKEPVDETAKQADLYCKNEIKKSGLSPFDLLDKKQIKACIVALRPQIKADCFKGVPKDLVLKIVITKDGTVTGAFAVGDGADSAEAQCVSEKIKETVFPKFSSKETQIIEKYPVSLGQ